jgi:hypothetical protein
MGAFDELRQSGTPGPETVALLVRLTIQAGRGFPPPLGHPRWDEGAGIDRVGTLLDRKEGLGFVAAAMVKARSQEELERQLLTSIRNDLIDEAKATAIGRLRRRLETLLGADERFKFVRELFGGEDAWNLHENPELASGLAMQEVLALVESVPAPASLDLPSSGPTPRAAREALIKVAHAALQRVAAAIRAQTLARVLARRFDLEDIREVEDETDRPTEEPDIAIRAMAQSLYDGFTVDERWAIAEELELSAVEARFPGRGSVLVDGLRESLRVHCRTTDGRALVAALFRICAERAERDRVRSSAFTR